MLSPRMAESMDALATRSPFDNLLLSALWAHDGALLGPHLEPVDLPVRTQLERSNREIHQVYFPESGFASVVTNGHGERNIEIGLIGKEGMSGLAVVLGTDRSPHDTYMQSRGHGQRMAAASLRGAMRHSPGLRRCLLNFAHVFAVQTGQTCLANGRSKLEERLARWLLMAQDRLESESVNLTHEFLATMLGVRRPGVSVALKQLEDASLIQAARGLIVVIDRNGLVEVAGGAYGVAESEYRRVFARRSPSVLQESPLPA